MKDDAFQKELDVAKHQRDKISKLQCEVSNQSKDLDEIENLLNKSNLYIDNISSKVQFENTDIKKEQTTERIFSDIVNIAHNAGYENTSFYDEVFAEEVAIANKELLSHYQEYSKDFKFDAVDYAISGIIGTIAALVDLLFVTSINGNQVSPGPLKNGVEDLFSKILPPEKIKDFEKKFKVNYDISTNTGQATQDVLGLCPKYHRILSLGHDPLLGLIFGVKDLMMGTCSLIDGNARFVIQNSIKHENKNIIEAVITVFGHFLSDVATPSDSGKILSVPAPLTPLLQLIQSGTIEYGGEEYTISELTKKMYYDGYNFNHFVGMSVPVFIIEVLTRLSFFVKENLYYKKEVDFSNNPKLNTMLFLSNCILFAENAGKLIVTKNPMSINYVSWISTFVYGSKTLKWYSYDLEIGKMDHAQKYMDAQWQKLLKSSEGIPPLTIE